MMAWDNGFAAGAALALALAAPWGAAAGELVAAQAPSAALGARLDVMVYTPDGAPPDMGWPVVYLLHGHGGNTRSWTDKVDPDTIETGPDVTNLVSHFSGAYGTPFDARRFNAENVFTLVAERAAEGAAIPATYVTVGDDDGFGLWRGSFALFDTMRFYKLPIEFRVTDGDHVWSLWKVVIVDALVFMDGHFGPPE